ncbi:hypothetical protein FRC12_012537 [Ceratobasidium sp. 428]|nr:hypothetical protein FRC12_012537 [Ceratobasidium sp. 428]
MLAYDEHVRMAFTYLLASILIPTLCFSFALVSADKLSSSSMLSVLALSSTLPLAIHTTIYARLSGAQTARRIDDQTLTQPRLYDLFWALPAALYASISTLQRYFLVALYMPIMSPGYTSSRTVLGIIYMLGVMEWTTVSQLSVMLWRAAREIEAEDIEKIEQARL